MKTIFFLLIAFSAALIALPLSAQNPEIQRVLEKSRTALRSADYNGALSYTDSVLQLALQDPGLYAEKAKAEAWRIKGRTEYFLGNYDSATTYFNKAYPIAVQAYGPSVPFTLETQILAAWNDYHALRISQALNQADSVLQWEAQIPPCEAFAFAQELKGRAQGERHLIHQSFEYFFKAKAIREALAATDSLQLHHSYKWLAAAYSEIGSFDKSLVYGQKALSLLEHHNGNPVQRAQVYGQMAYTYDYRVEPQLMLACVQKEESLLQQVERISEIQRIQIQSDLARAYAALGDTLRSDSLYSSVINQLKNSTQPAARVQWCTSLHNYSNDLRTRGRLQEGLACLQQAAQIAFPLLDVQPSAPYLLASIYNGLLNVHHGMKQDEEAQHYFDTITAFIKPRLGPRNPILIQVYNNYGLVLVKLGHFAQAITTYDSCLQILHASSDDPFDTWLSPVEASIILWNRAEAYDRLFAHTGDSMWLQRSWQDFDRYVGFLDFLRSSYRDEGSKIGLADENREAYDKALITLFRVNGKKRSLAMREKAFDYITKSSALVLAEAVNRNGALKDAIPPHWAEREQRLRRAITDAEQQMYNEIQGNPAATVAIADEAQRTITQHKMTFYRFLDSLKSNYPEYHALRYTTNTPSLSEVQSTLNTENQGFIAYFVGTESLFIFFASADTALALMLPVDSVAEWVKQMNIALTTPQSKSLAKQHRIESSYQYAAYQLFQRLVAPLGPLIPRRIVIAPEGPLCYVAFDALLSKAPTANDRDFRQLPYLGLNHVISYNYSAALLQKTREKKHTAPASEPMLVMAPFDASEGISDVGTLSALPFSGKEARAVAGIYHIPPRLGNSASKGFAIKNASKYRQISLITHGGGALADLSSDAWIALTVAGSNPLRYERLSAREIYLLSLNADLITLSACETGIGKMQPGEGPLSLARAFIYAGAKSVVNSFWQVNDESTEQIMRIFHQNLVEGKPKDEALWLARMQYLSGCTLSESAHPFFWAAFAPVGDMRALNK